MSATLVTRPVVRSFHRPYLADAVTWVRAGGHAVVWLSTRKARLVFARPREDSDVDLGRWSALDLGRSGFSVATQGTFAGMAYVRVPHDCYSIVRARVVRDSIHPGPTRELLLDCLACAACCKDNHVELEDEDVTRFQNAGRDELARPPYARRENGTIVLVLRKDKSCKHLGELNQCGIYDIRPNACSMFPPGSECCLSAREEETGVVDGMRA